MFIKQYANSEELISVPELRPEFVALRSGLTAYIGLEQVLVLNLRQDLIDNSFP